MSSKIVPREYQARADAALSESIDAGLSPVASLPTGSGKSLTLALRANQIEGRTLVVSHRKELLEQDYSALQSISEGGSAGIYSAGLEKRDTDQKVIFGGCQSIYKRMNELMRVGPFKQVVVDEAHLVPRSTDTMYGEIIRAARERGASLSGLTATPYRLDSGMLHEGKDALFNHLCIHIPHSELTPQYLSPLVGIGGESEVDTEGVRIQGGEFVTRELEQIACDASLINRTCKEMVALAAGRKHCLVFCVSVDHCEMIQLGLELMGETVAAVTGRDSSAARAAKTADFKEGRIRWLANCEIYTTGFDFPAIDCIVMLRPTQSRGLYIQQMGRGARRADGKENCGLLDFAGNVRRHGSMDMLMDYRPSQREKAMAEKKKTYQERGRTIHHFFQSLGDDPNSPGQFKPAVVPVKHVRYFALPAKNKPGITHLVAEYRCEGNLRIKTWVCVELTGAGRWFAEQWFHRRGVYHVPRSAEMALKLAWNLPIPEAVLLTYDGEWPRVKIEYFTMPDTPSEDVA